MSAKTLSPKKRMLVKRVGIAGLKLKLAGFEKKYGMSTQIFLKKLIVENYPNQMISLIGWAWQNFIATS